MKRGVLLSALAALGATVAPATVIDDFNFSLGSINVGASPVACSVAAPLATRGGAGIFEGVGVRTAAVARLSGAGCVSGRISTASGMFRYSSAPSTAGGVLLTGVGAPVAIGALAISLDYYQDGGDLGAAGTTGLLLVMGDVDLRAALFYRIFTGVIGAPDDLKNFPLLFAGASPGFDSARVNRYVLVALATAGMDFAVDNIMAVPEPVTRALVGGALASLALVRRRATRRP